MNDIIMYFSFKFTFDYKPFALIFVDMQMRKWMYRMLLLIVEVILHILLLYLYENSEKNKFTQSS